MMEHLIKYPILFEKHGKRFGDKISTVSTPKLLRNKCKSLFLYCGGNSHEINGYLFFYDSLRARITTNVIQMLFASKMAVVTVGIY